MSARTDKDMSGIVRILCLLKQRWQASSEKRRLRLIRKKCKHRGLRVAGLVSWNPYESETCWAVVGSCTRCETYVEREIYNVEVEEYMKKGATLIGRDRSRNYCGLWQDGREQA
jgi:hypothetical protein